MKNAAEIREALSGPVPSIATPFLQNGDIDYKSLAKMIDLYIQSRMKTILLTPGDSHYILLSDQEIAEVTKFVVDETAGRAMVIAADRHYATPQAVNFAKYTREIGADLYMPYPPDWVSSMTPETCSDHYAAIGEFMPIMMLFCPFKGEANAWNLFDLTFEKTDALVALKDDVCGPISRKMCLRYNDRVAVISGGQKQNHLNILPYGCDGFLSTYASFLPEIAWKYWAAIEKNDIPAAIEIIEKYDMPYFDMILGMTGSFDTGIHAALEVFGLAERWRRQPYYSAGEAEMEQVRDFFKGLKLL
jgi:dihydrodipicolinate synthase/N-acetylneuraminate lyase